MSRSVAEKLLIKPATTLWCSHAGYAGRLEPVPDGVTRVDRFGDTDTALVFAEDAGSLRTILAAQRSDLAKPAALWVVYPKGNRTDVNRDSLWPILREYGLRPVTQVAVDDVWSALRFRPLKEGESFPPAR